MQVPGKLPIREANQAPGVEAQGKLGLLPARVFIVLCPRPPALHFVQNPKPFWKNSQVPKSLCCSWSKSRSTQFSNSLAHFTMAPGVPGPS